MKGMRRKKSRSRRKGMRWMRRMVWWLVNRMRCDLMYRIELFVLFVCGMYVCLFRVLFYVSFYIFCYFCCLFYCFEIGIWCVVFDVVVVIGVEVVICCSCVDVWGVFFLGWGGVVVYVVVGDVLVVYVGLWGLDVGVRGGEGVYRWLVVVS